MRELTEAQALERLRRKLPGEVSHASIREARPDEYWLALTCDTRDEALALYGLFREPEDIAIMRFARGGEYYRIKPLDVVSEWEQEHAAQLIDGCHPVIWRLSSDGKCTLEWWHRVMLRKELESQVLVNASVEIRHDPGHMQRAYRKGGHSLTPRNFPHGELCIVSRETSTDRIVWFPTRGPSLSERLALK